MHCSIYDPERGLFRAFVDYSSLCSPLDSFDTHSFETDPLDLLRPARSSNEFVDSKRSHLPILSTLTLVMHSPKGIFKLDCVKTLKSGSVSLFYKEWGDWHF